MSSQFLDGRNALFAEDIQLLKCVPGTHQHGLCRAHTEILAKQTDAQKHTQARTQETRKGEEERNWKSGGEREREVGQKEGI